MAYVIEASEKDKSALFELLPINRTLPNGLNVDLVYATEVHHEQMRQILNYTIEEGGTYPIQKPLTMEQFKNYYVTHDAFCVVPSREELSKGDTNVKENQVLGCYYIKPNYPGACSHICNGGFLTEVSMRRKGIARFMGETYLKLARVLGYKASMFNLVFVTNVGSVLLWRSLGFKELAIVPKAGYYPNIQADYIDAIQFYYDLTQE